MNRRLKMLLCRLGRRSGGTLLEYAVILFIISIVGLPILVAISVRAETKTIDPKAVSKMNEIFAYVFAVIGIPNIIGIIVGDIASSRFDFLIKTRGDLELVVQDVFSGFGCLVAGIGLFRLFGLVPTFIVPTISGIWSYFYYRSPIYGRIRLRCYLSGLIIGWICYAVFILHPIR